MVKVVGDCLDTPKRITCRTCAAILEYTLSDIKRIDSKDISGGPDGREWIDCPRCSHVVVIRAW